MVHITGIEPLVLAVLVLKLDRLDRIPCYNFTIKWETQIDKWCPLLAIFFRLESSWFRIHDIVWFSHFFLVNTKYWENSFGQIRLATWTGIHASYNYTLYKYMYSAFRENELLASVRIQFAFSVEIKGERLVDIIGCLHGTRRCWRPGGTVFRAVT